jgi:hypothetical protein
VFFAEFDGPREREVVVTVVAARAAETPAEELSRERQAEP